MHDADRGVTIADLVDHDPYSDKVMNVIEIAAADDHLLINRVIVFRSTLDSSDDSRSSQLRGDLIDNSAQVGVPGRCAIGHKPHDLVIFLRMKDRERQVLQLPLDGGHTQPVSQRGENLESL